MDGSVICTWRAYFSSDFDGVCRDLDCMLVGFTTTCAISAYHQ
jgi:hypothetical protein